MHDSEMTTNPVAGGARPNLDRLATLVLASLVMGLAFGLVLRNWPLSPLASGAAGALDVIGAMWVNAIRMTVIPLILPLLIGAIAGAKNGAAVGRLGHCLRQWCS